jgi:outer membrane protein assembly factor BamD (BamD/ComL family)
MKALCAILAAFALLLSAVPATPQDLSPERIMSFADHLFAQEDYYRAITEYERLVFLFPGHSLAKTARFQIALSYFKGEKLGPAIERFGVLAEELRSDNLGRKALFMLGETYYRKGDFSKARETFESFVRSYPDDAQADAARIKIAWSHLRQGNWREAAEEFGKLPPESPLHEQSAGLTAESLKYPGLPHKSPSLAGTLSAVLPGAGQLYVGRPGDAVMSFLLNGVFIWGAIEAFRNDNETTGGILLFFEAGWYAGNIYNAVSGAHKFNRAAERDFMDRLESRYGISYSRGRDGVNALVFTVRF